MKKFLLLITVMFSSLFFTINVKALTYEDLIQTFENDYNNNNPYCVLSSSLSVYCSSNTNNIRYKSSSTTRFYNTIERFDYVVNNDEYVLNSHDTFNYSSSGVTNNFTIKYSNFDVYNTSLSDIMFYSNTTFGSIGTTLYTITFNPPRNSTIVVKNSNNEEIQATSQYTYELEAGTYTYSVTNNLYNNLNNITFIVSQDETIDITMNERLNNQPIRSIYSQYYNYLSELIKDVFGLENPLFLYIAAFIIGFSLITLIRRLIGGR